MKRVFSMLLALTLLLSVCVLPGAAADYGAKYGGCAEALWYDGLFFGTGATFALDKPLTRAEGVTMAVRLLGKDQEAKYGSNATPFTDLPVWAVGYVSYAYKNGITWGVSDTLFGADRQMTATQFLTLALRALGYNDSAGDFSWDSAEEKAVAVGLVKGGEFSGEFLRDHAVYICYNALGMKLKGSDKTLRETISCPGQLKSALMPSPTSNTLPTGYLSLTPPSVTMKPGETASVDVSAFIGNSTSFKMTVASSSKSVATTKWDGSIVRGSAYTTGTVLLTAVAKGSCDVTVTVYNSDMTLRYYYGKISVTVSDTSTPSPSPTATPTPTSTPKPTATPAPTPSPITEFSLRVNGNGLYGLTGVQTSFDYWLTGAKGCTVSIEPFGGTYFGARAPDAPVYDSVTGVSHGAVYVQIFNDKGVAQTDYLNFVVKDATGNVVREKLLPLKAVPSTLKYPTSLRCAFGSTYTVEAGATGDHAIQVEKSINNISVEVYIEDASIAQFVSANAQYTKNSQGVTVFNGYFDLHIKGLRTGATKAVVCTFVDGRAWQREEFTVQVVASGSIPERCPLCYGKEICLDCMGQGFTRNPLDALEKWPCITCGGTGVCPVCHGTGDPPIG